MKVTAIVQRYYPSRRGYIFPILKSLASQTLRPEKVILWNNFEPAGTWSDDFEEKLPVDYMGLNLHVVHSSENTMMGRYAAILLTETEYVYIQDDDLIMDHDVVGKLCAASHKFYGQLVGPFGSKLNHNSDNPYTLGTRIMEGRASVILGRCFVASRHSLLRRLLHSNANIPFGRCDDIIMSLAGDSYVVPNCGFTNLDERQTGLSHEPEHFSERDAMARRLLSVS